MRKGKKESESEHQLSIPSGADQSAPPEAVEQQEQEDENYCYIAMFVPGFHVGWRRFFLLDERGFFVARSDVDFRKIGAE
jgi:hypothetical protein